MEHAIFLSVKIIERTRKKNKTGSWIAIWKLGSLGFIEAVNN
jgi:hypothetical protein